MGATALSGREAMSEGGDLFTTGTHRFKTNPLLSRRQFVCDVIHPGMASASKKDLASKLASMYKVHDLQTIQLFGFHTAFGGGRSSGFGLSCDNLDKMKRFEPQYRLKRAGLGGDKTGAWRCKESAVCLTKKKVKVFRMM